MSHLHDLRHFEILVGKCLGISPEDNPCYFQIIGVMVHALMMGFDELAVCRSLRVT